MTRGDLLINEASLLVKRLVRLCDDIVILGVGGHILDLAGNHSLLLVYAAVRSLDEAVIVDARIGGKVGDKSDVRSLRGLDRTHTSVVCIVDIAHLEGCTVTRDTARTERGETALVRQLCKRVVLVHELRERRRAEELADSGDDGTDIDKRLGRDGLAVVNGHALLDYLIHTRKADAELILKQLAYAAQTAVAEMIDIVLLAYAVEQTYHVADRRENIVPGDVLRRELGDALLCLSLYVALLGTDRSDYLGENAVADLMAQTDILKTVAKYSLGVYHAVREQFKLCTVDLNINLVDRARTECGKHLLVYDVALVSDKLTCDEIDRRTCKQLSAQTGLKIHLAVVLITTDRCEIIAFGVEEEVVDEYLRALNKRRVAGAQTLVYLLERLVYRACVVLKRLTLHLILCKRLAQAMVVAEQLDYFLVGLKAERADKDGQRHLAVLIDTDVHDVVHVGLVLYPCAAVRDDLSGVDELSALVEVMVIVHAGRADDLRNDNALRAVDDKGTVLGHQREVAHEYLLDDRRTCSLVEKADGHAERCGVVNVSLLALLYRVLGLGVYRVVDELDLEISRIIGDRGDITKNFHQSLTAEPLVGLLLNINEIRQVQSLIDLGKAHTCVLTELLGLYHLNNHSIHIKVFGKNGAPARSTQRHGTHRAGENHPSERQTAVP